MMTFLKKNPNKVYNFDSIIEAVMVVHGSI